MIEHTWRELERADMDTAAAHAFDEERRTAMTDNRTTLLPCPFCGGSVSVHVCVGDWYDENDEIDGDSYNWTISHNDLHSMCELRSFYVRGIYRTLNCVEANEQKQRLIAAWNTRAERTCRIEGRYGNQYCTCCGEMVGTWDSTSELYIDGNMVELWNYCPNCGAKVV